jgi:hypothetical protein
MRPTFMIAARTRREYDSLNVGGDPLPPHRQEVVGSAVGFERSLLPPGPVVRRRSPQLALAELPSPCPRAEALREALECIPGIGLPPAPRGRAA